MNASLSSSVEPGPPTPVAKPSRGGGRGWLAVLFVVYLVLLAWVVLWKLEVPYVGGGALRQMKLVPFARTAEAGASAPLEVVANVMLFVPFGPYPACSHRRVRGGSIEDPAYGLAHAQGQGQLHGATGTPTRHWSSGSP